MTPIDVTAQIKAMREQQQVENRVNITFGCFFLGLAVWLVYMIVITS